MAFNRVTEKGALSMESLDRDDFSAERDTVYKITERRAEKALAAAEALIAPLLPPDHPPGVKPAHVLDEMRAQLSAMPSDTQEIMRLRIALLVAEVYGVTDTLVQHKEEIVQRLRTMRKSSNAASAYTRNTAVMSGLNADGYRR